MTLSNPLFPPSSKMVRNGVMKKIKINFKCLKFLVGLKEGQYHNNIENSIPSSNENKNTNESHLYYFSKGLLVEGGKERGFQVFILHRDGDVLVIHIFWRRSKNFIQCPSKYNISKNTIDIVYPQTTRLNYMERYKGSPQTFDCIFIVKMTKVSSTKEPPVQFF